jgi:hypothetical protein
MRTVKLRWVLVAAVSAALVSSAAIAATMRSSEAASKPALAIVSESPLVVVGRGFKAGERVSLLAATTGGKYRSTRSANRLGRFTTRFDTGPTCGPVFLSASGTKGSRAHVRIRGIAPPCGAEP